MADDSVTSPGGNVAPVELRAGALARISGATPRRIANAILSGRRAVSWEHVGAAGAGQRDQISIVSSSVASKQDGNVLLSRSLGRPDAGAGASRTRTASAARFFRRGHSARMAFANGPRGLSVIIGEAGTWQQRGKD